MIKAPPDRQVANMLLFLSEALQTDPVIIEETESEASDIVAYVANYQPLQRADGKTWIYVSQLPALCFNVTSATHKRRGASWGRILTGNLWYIFQTPQSEDADMHGLTKAERFKGLIDWRINYWLHKQTFTREDDTTLNMQTTTGIRKITVGASDWFNEGNIEGLRMTLELEHYTAPYTEDTPAVVAQYDVDITEHTLSDDDLKVEATIDV